MKVLVTGSSGFVGGYFCRLMESAYPNIQLLKARRAPTENAGRGNEVIIGEINEATDWTEAVTGQDVVVHMAGRVHNHSQEGSSIHQVNVLGTRRLAVEASKAGVKRFVFISSIGVNGATTRGRPPFTAEDSPEAQGVYACSKWRAEEALKEVEASSDMEVVVIRPPLVYGPDAPGNFARLVRCVRRGIPLPFGGLRNERSFISVYNLVDFIATCIKHPDAAGRVFLVKDGQDLSTAGFIHRIGCAMGKKARLIPFPESVMRGLLIAIGQRSAARSLLDSLVVDSREAEVVLGWRPPYSVEESLRHCFSQ